ncbi:MAG: aldo/keto reductase [Verrucomicrobiota bacterium]
MKFAHIASIEKDVSRLGLGTVKIGRNQGVKYPKAFDLPSDNEVVTLLETARDQGINLIDTAPAYGLSEERLGKLMTHRDDWVICSKAGEDFQNGESSHDFSGSAITASVERSLRRLKTDRIDCLLLHSDGQDMEILNESGAVEALFALKEAGKVLSIGISTKTIEGGLHAFELGMDIVMATYNPWHTEEAPILEKAAELGRTVFVKKAFGSGWLGNQDDAKPMSPAETLQFTLNHPCQPIIITGTINQKHLIDNCAAVD